jgi:DNA glycosylase AlkZ-like
VCEVAPCGSTPAAATRALTPGNHPVVLVDDAVAGVWHQRRSGRKVAVTVELLREPTAKQRRLLEAEVERVGAMLAADATMSLGPVSVGAHA